MIGVGVFMVSWIYLATNVTFFDTLINMGAILVINEFDEIYGRVFMIHLKTFHMDMIN